MAGKRQRPGGFGITFLELGVVMALVIMLSSVGFNMMRGARKSAQRVRCRAALAQVHRLEILHAASNGAFSDQFPALEEMGLPAPLDPTYRFSLHINQRRDAFRCLAWANLDRDAALDSLLVDQSGKVQSVVED